MLILSICFWFSFSSHLSTVTSSTCGLDNSPDSNVNGDKANIETYPWLGVLFYPNKNGRYTTAVVLVTRQMAIAAALEIEKLLKNGFRDKARVIVGHNCSSEPGVPIREYAYHSEYSKNIFSTIALIQLETDDATITLRPICPPPKLFQFHKDIFAMVISGDCNRSKMRIHKMMIVSTEKCQQFYKLTELDIESLWPTHTICARSVKGDCVWPSGVILTAKLENRWRLLGFGVHGPGCQAPARFLDYAMYHDWVKLSVQRIGRPAITKIAQNHVVLRRSLSNVQRFGACSKDEMVKELYTDSTEMRRGDMAAGVYHYNITIVDDVEYSCVVLRADSPAKNSKPILRLRRYCSGLKMTSECFTGLQFIKIDFYVVVSFKGRNFVFSVKAYGRRVKAIDPTRAHKYANVYSNPYAYLMSYDETKLKFFDRLDDPEYHLYGKESLKDENRYVTGPRNETRNPFPF